MKFTLSWLKSVLETEASTPEICEALTDLGLEVEGISDPSRLFEAFEIGYVSHAEKHPDADKLKICTVQIASGPTQIICGAPNAREGITVVVAKPGTYIPGLDITISVGKIRGVESHGMMCSAKELELGEDHDGIIELPSGDVGESFAAYLAEHDPARIDPVIEIAITPNRPDALGVIGVARDLAARGLGRLKPLPELSFTPAYESDLSVSIDEDTRGGCPIFAVCRIRGVKNAQSPEYLQSRLTAIGLRPINFLVDVTNYFAYHYNRPLHVFDAAKVTGNLRIHRAKGGEQMEALDDKTYTLAPGQMVISDDAGVQSIAGIMGGAATGCDTSTTDVIVESAFWDPVDIAYTGRALRINSDARYRFERGIDPTFTLEGLQRAVQMIVEQAGGEPSALVVAGQIPDVSRTYRLDTDRVQSLVGMQIPAKEQRDTLERLGFKVAGDEVKVPSWRPDVQGEADLVEEIARIASLGNLVPQPLARMDPGVPAPVLNPMQQRERLMRSAIAADGYNECVTYSFIDQKSAALFGGGDDTTRIQNPISSEMSHMRPDLLPGLLQAAARNQARGEADMALFELGAIFYGGKPGEQKQQAAGLLIGHTGPRDVFKARREVDIFDAKASAEAALRAANAPSKMQTFREGPAWWHPGRHGRLCLGPKKTLAIFGEIHPRVLAEFGIKGPAVAFSIWPEEIPLPRKTGHSRGKLDASSFQSVERDFAFILAQEVEAATVVGAALGADKSLISGARVFDEFTGGSLGEGKKSLALSVKLQPKDETLTEKQIEQISARIVEKVHKATGGELRR